MLVIVAFVSQKGGVGKSTLARALAAVAAANKIRVRVADLDTRQNTVANWHDRRQENKAGPRLEVASFASPGEAIAASRSSNELLIIDAPAGTSNQTLEIARHADLVVQPTGAGIDDLDPAIILFHELVRAGVPRDRLVMAFCRTSTEAEESAARAYVAKAGYAVLPGAIPEHAAFRDAHNRGAAITEARLKTLSARADALMARLLNAITDRVRSRVLAAKARGKTA
jgi:chromosome partitioning protein